METAIMIDLRKALWEYQNKNPEEYDYVILSKQRGHDAFKSVNKLDYHTDWSDINERPKIEPTPCRTSLRLHHERQGQ